MKRRNICYYVSDYGNGHAARAIAIIRRIQEEWEDARIHVRTAGPTHFMQQSLRSCIHYHVKNDIGVILDQEHLSVDRERTEDLFRTWMGSWDDYLLHEENFCREEQIDCILSDIAPQPFIISESLSIPSIAISNFTWYAVFSALFGQVDEIDMLREAYQHADLALVLPFHEPMEIFHKRQEIGLVSRSIMVDREHLRKNCGVMPDDRLVYVGCGQVPHPLLKKALQKITEPGIKFLVSSNVDLKGEQVIAIPKGEIETQNYMAICDLIVTKCGYSTISEAVSAQVPVLLYRREGFSEDAYLIRGVERIGAGREISWRSFIEGDWITEVDMMDLRNSFKFTQPFSSHGVDDMMTCLAEVVR
ncbi:hypothetical protein DSECCO2_293680 [anaerobic digester metagenome]